MLLGGRPKIKLEEDAGERGYHSTQMASTVTSHIEQVREMNAGLAAEAGLEEKNLQLALCLTGDALSSLLLLSPEDRSDNDALVGALKRHLPCVQRLACSALNCAADNVMQGSH